MSSFVCNKDIDCFIRIRKSRSKNIIKTLNVIYCTAYSYLINVDIPRNKQGYVWGYLLSYFKYSNSAEIQSRKHTNNVHKQKKTMQERIVVDSKQHTSYNNTTLTICRTKGYPSRGIIVLMSNTVAF